MANTVIPASSVGEERVKGRGIPKAFVFALVPAAVINILLLVVAQMAGLDFKGIAWPMIIVSNAVVLVIASVVLLILGRISRRPFRIFTILAVIFLVLFGLQPIAASINPVPMLTGVLPTSAVIVLEVMHIVSGIFAIWAFRRYARA